MSLRTLMGSFLCGLALPSVALALPSDPFVVSAGLVAGTNDTRRLEVSISVPEKHYLYADQFRVETNEGVLSPAVTPDSKQKEDPFSGEKVFVYEHDVVLEYVLQGSGGAPVGVTVSYQGCNDKVCFLPSRKVLSVEWSDRSDAEADFSSSQTAADHLVQEQAPLHEAGQAVSGDGGPEDWRRLVEGFTRGGSASGYLNADEFRAFLSSAREERKGGEGDWKEIVAKKGWLVAFLLILLGGLALNFTPCVLPMIPVNLAIIGAGTGAANQRRGLILGSAYGGGMAFVYGVLGLLVILTGARFGSLNASPWFNAVIAVLFLVMALAMFDLIHIDLSRFQSSAGGGRKGSLPTAFFFGGVMALLAGACVAPVVISVLFFATNLYAGGHVLALLLPFLLGVGMALPWPLAGAGLSILPKPGRWMQYVKAGFGVIILAVAVYYGHLAASLFLNLRAAARGRVEQAQLESMKEGWMSSLPVALNLASQQ